MIKDIDNAIILTVNVYESEKDVIKDGDILVYNKNNNRWELCKSGLNISNTVFGIVCDDNNGLSSRTICIEGIIEANIEETSHPFGELTFFKSTQNSLSFVASVKRPANGFLLRYLPSKYGKVRGLVKIWNNTNYEIVIA